MHKHVDPDKDADDATRFLGHVATRFSDSLGLAKSPHGIGATCTYETANRKVERVEDTHLKKMILNTVLE
jgi:hypothetical protein